RRASSRASPPVRPSPRRSRSPHVRRPRARRSSSSSRTSASATSPPRCTPTSRTDVHDSRVRFWVLLREDLEAARRGDPAARSLIEVALGYPGVHALWAHRLCHRMWHASPLLKLPARLLSQLVRALTGIEI